VRLGERFTGAALIAGNPAFAAMWGGLMGTPLIGGAMQLWGPIGLPAMSPQPWQGVDGNFSPTRIAM
jgi:hypothetical protein